MSGHSLSIRTASMGVAAMHRKTQFVAGLLTCILQGHDKFTWRAQAAMRSQKMMRKNTTDPKATGLKLLFMCGLGLCLVEIAVPIKCFAQSGVQTSIQPTGDVTSFPLSNSAISTIRAAGSQGPSSDKSSTSTGTIMLWDELKPTDQQQNLLSGVQPMTTNGAAK